MFLDFIQLTLIFGVGAILVNVIDMVLDRHIKRGIILTLVELVVGGVFLFLILPSKNLSSLLWMNLSGAVIAAGILMLFNGVESVVHKVEGRRATVSEPKLKGHAWRLMVLAIIGMVVLGLVSSITNITSINNVYKTIPATTEVKAEVLTSTKDTPIAIAPETAKRKMLQKFSVIPNSNMYKLDGITAQTINGKYVYVATVEFNGFWKWLKLRDLPGYFVISATDINAQPEFVDTKFAYSTSAYFTHDAGRKIYAAFPGYAATGKINLEIDDKGNPYYIQTLYKEYGVSGRMHYNEFKTAVLNAKTGEAKLYDIAKAPAFVDAPMTSAAANSMNEFFGRYSNGWWNQFIFGAKKDVKVPTENGIYASGQITPMLDHNGNLLYFTDFTSGNNDQDSALGYSLINARTGKLVYYRDPSVGIMDSDGALSIASKIYPEKKWDAKMPILYNIDGIPTWIVSLMDSKGIFKKYVYINAVDNDIVVDGENAQSALDAYRIEVATKGSNNASTDKSSLQEHTGVVERVALVSTDDTTTVSFILKGSKTIYTVNSNNSPLAIFIKEGDTVTFSANVMADTTAASIENLTIEGLQ
jgi:hypothetical protein